jgi:hypothetical protein
LIFTSTLLISCNAFDPLDSPTSDEQYLSAARNCLDEGDLACARDWYGKISRGSGDTRAGELAFTTLSEYGGKFEDFIASAGSTGAGAAALNTLANRLSAGAGVGKRLGFYSAYKYTQYIQDPEYRGFVRFITALFLAAEILAEDSGSDGILQKTDLILSTTACSCTNCSASTTSLLSLSTREDILFAPDQHDFSGSPTMGMLDGALAAVSYALSTELVAAGKFGSGTTSFTQALLNTSTSNNQCYRYALVNAGVGI